MKDGLPVLDNIRALNPHRRDQAAFAALVAACAIASQTYSVRVYLLLPNKVSYIPDLISGIVAILLVLPVIRGDFLYRHKIGFLTAVNLLLIFYLTAAFANIGMGGSSFMMKTPTTVFTLLVIMLANFNPGRYGELAIFALAVFGGLNLYSANVAMGFWGFLLALFSFLGILLAVDLQKVVRNIRARPSS